MSFDSSSMDLGLRLASCLCEVGRGTFVSDNWGTNMRKMGFGRSRISLLPKGCTKWIMTCGKVMNLIFVIYPEDSLGCCGTPWGREVSPFMPRLAAGEPEVFDLIMLMDKNPPPVDMENISVFLGFYTGGAGFLPSTVTLPNSTGDESFNGKPRWLINPYDFTMYPTNETFEQKLADIFHQKLNGTLPTDP